jgi:hypothetical protein
MNNECEAILVSNLTGTWQAKYAGEWLRNKAGRVRVFKSERAAMEAAYLARDGKDNRPSWRKRGRRA